MPYTIVKRGNKYAILDENGKTVGAANTKSDAEKSVRARLAGEHGWKPKGKKK